MWSNAKERNGLFARRFFNEGMLEHARDLVRWGHDTGKREKHEMAARCNQEKFWARCFVCAYISLDSKVRLERLQRPEIADRYIHCEV